MLRLVVLATTGSLNAVRPSGDQVGLLVPMSRYDDDDDWVGTPPEGRYTRDRAKPEFWWRQRPIVPAAAGIFVVVVVILIVVLLG
jgi:hypothetical protein